MPYYVYVILCQNGSFYTGYTGNVESRVKLHASGKGARYTRMHTPKRLVYTESFSSRSEAMKRERRVKAMGHREKRLMIRMQAKKRQTQSHSSGL